jgi:hypothetical protein
VEAGAVGGHGVERGRRESAERGERHEEQRHAVVGGTRFSVLIREVSAC